VLGKVIFLKQLLNQIKQEQDDIQTVYINKEDYAFDEMKTYADLIKYVESKVAGSAIALFIDEIQDIENFEKALRHFYTKEIYDIYCTGSNAKLLSGELSTLLSGRTIEIEMNSLIYPEYLQFHKLKDSSQSFERYLVYGGMPNLIHFEQTEEVVYDYLRNVFNTIIVKDVLTRYAIRNVAYRLDQQSTIKREFGNLEKIKNNYPKLVVSMDKSSHATINGIKHLHIREFCLMY